MISTLRNHECKAVLAWWNPGCRPHGCICKTEFSGPGLIPRTRLPNTMEQFTPLPLNLLGLQNQGSCSLWTIGNVLWLLLAPDLFPRNSFSLGQFLAWTKTTPRKREQCELRPEPSLSFIYQHKQSRFIILREEDEVSVSVGCCEIMGFFCCVTQQGEKHLGLVEVRPVWVMCDTSRLSSALGLTCDFSSPESISQPVLGRPRQFGKECWSRNLVASHEALLCLLALVAMESLGLERPLRLWGPATHQHCQLLH